jgi:hypothetical protein
MLELKVDASPKYPDCKAFLVEISELDLNLKKVFEFEGKKLYLKDEFHLTLVGNDDSLLLRNKFIELVGEEKIGALYGELEIEIKKLIADSKIDFISEFYILRKKYPDDEFARTSLIQLVKTDLMNKFQEMLELKYNILLQNSSSLPHITLYKELDNFGIGLYSKEDLEKYSIKRLESLN